MQNTASISTPKRQRRCISCNTIAGKQSLLRVVRDKDGQVFFDKTGRIPGRGAYVCSTACLDRACKTGRLSRALKTTVSDQDAQCIVEEVARTLQNVQ